MLGANWRRWNWLDFLVVPLLSIGMRVAWIAPLPNLILASGMFYPAKIHIPAWLPFVLLLAASALTRLTSGLTIAPVIISLAGLLAIFGSLAIFVPAPGSFSLNGYLLYWWNVARDWQQGVPNFWLVLIYATALWWRGTSANWDNPNQLQNGFRTGVIALGCISLLSFSGPAQGLFSTNYIFTAIISFVICSLGAFALADIARTARQSLRVSGHVPKLGLYWLLNTALVVGAVLLIGWLLAFLLSPQSINTVISWLAPVLKTIGTAIYYILMPIAYVIFWLLGPVIYWFSALLGKPRESNRITYDDEDWRKQLENLPHKVQESQNLPVWFQIFLAIVLIGGLAALFFIAVRRRTHELSDGVVESREVDWSAKQMIEQISDWLNSRRRKAKSGFLALEGNDSRARIRAAYARMLQLMAERNLERKRWQTPWLYQHTLEDHMPDLQQPLQLLTSAYMVARYSPLMPGEERVEISLGALATIEKVIREKEAQAAANSS